MSKITNDGLTRSGTGCFIAVPYGNSGRQRVNISSSVLESAVKTFGDRLKLLLNSFTMHPAD